MDSTRVRFLVFCLGGVDALSRRTFVSAVAAASLRCNPPIWLAGEWVVIASRFEGVQGFEPFGPTTVPGARRGTCIALPNVGAAPRNYRQRYGTPDDDLFNDAQTLRAFWDDVVDVDVRRVSDTRRSLSYTAPTTTLGRRRQRADVDVLHQACVESSESAWATDATLKQATYIDDLTLDTSKMVSGTFAISERYERLTGDDLRVRKTLRVSVPRDDTTSRAPMSLGEFALNSVGPRTSTVYDYSFLLTRDQRY